MEISILLLALISPLLYAATNHIDNILLSKYFKEGGVGTLMLFSALLSIIALPILYLLDPSVLDVETKHLWLLLFVGAINTLLLWAYLKALFTDEPTVVVIYYQLVPLLGLVLGYIILGETITSKQTWAMANIILGTVILTFATDDDGIITPRLKTAGYMLIASLCWATETTIFKLVALEENLWRSLFWEHVALFIIGILMLTFISKYREMFVKALKVNSKQILSLNIANEALYITGNSVAAFVVLLIPVSLTLLMNSFQPLFVLIMGFLLTWLFPKLGVVHVRNKNMWQKIVAIILTAIGVYLLQ